MLYPLKESSVNEPTPLIVQARVQSTRYPGKMLQPFAEGCSLLAFQLQRLKESFPANPLVVATSTAAADDPIEALVREMEVHCFRGDEQDVLKRFVKCCQYFGFNRQIIRICGDNPFLQPEFLSTLIEEAATQAGKYDYTGFSIGDLPAIRTHFGFFAELVAVKALSYVSENVPEAYFREHVTSYIYEHPGEFSVRLLEIDALIPFLDSLRLTVDSREDFENAVHIYRQLHPIAGQPLGWKDILSLMENEPETKRRMTEQIRLYNK